MKIHATSTDYVDFFVSLHTLHFIPEVKSNMHGFFVW